MSLPCAQHCTNLLLCEMLNTKFPCSRPTSCSDRHLLLKTGRSGEIPGTLREKDRAVLSHLPTREGHLCFRKQALLIPASRTRDSTRCCLMKIACQRRTRQGGPEQTHVRHRTLRALPGKPSSISLNSSRASLRDMRRALLRSGSGAGQKCASSAHCCRHDGAEDPLRANINEDKAAPDIPDGMQSCTEGPRMQAS